MRKGVGGVILVACFLLGYVQQRVIQVSLGYRVEQLRHLKDDLLDQHQVLHYNVLTLQSPVILSQRLARSDVQMAPPKLVEVVVPRAQLVPVAQPGQGPTPSRDDWLAQVKRLSARWLAGGRQAEAEPVIEGTSRF